MSIPRHREDVSILSKGVKDCGFSTDKAEASSLSDEVLEMCQWKRKRDYTDRKSKAGFYYIQRGIKQLILIRCVTKQLRKNPSKS